MSRYDNYPDDIRQYDDDPRSPFYNQPECPHCGEYLASDEVCTCQEDPTPWCHCCGSMTQAGCDCGPFAENH